MTGDLVKRKVILKRLRSILKQPARDNGLGGRWLQFDYGTGYEVGHDLLKTDLLRKIAMAPGVAFGDASVGAQSSG